MSDIDWQAMFSADQSAADLVFGALIGSVLGLALTKDGVVHSDYASLALTLFILSGFVYFNNGIRAYAVRKQWRGSILYFVVACAFIVPISFLIVRIGVDPLLISTALVTWLFVTLLDTAGRVAHRLRAEG